MHISKLQIVNYRNFKRANVVFNKGVNTIIGENGSGKTNLFRAIRLLLDDNLLRMAYKLDDQDFHRGLDDWRGHWIIISLEFDEVSKDEAIQALFLHSTGVIEADTVERATYNLIFRPKVAVRTKLGQLEAGDKEGLALIRKDITIADYESVFSGRSPADLCDPSIYRKIVGDFDTVEFPDELKPPEIGIEIRSMLSLAKEVSFTFVQALRDVVSDFQNQRTNPLLTLLKRKSGEIDPATSGPISKMVSELNDTIGDLDEVKTIRSEISETILHAAGETYSPRSLAIKSELPEEAEHLFQSLKLFVGEAEEGYQGAIHELSLGGANLIYLSLKLLEFKYRKQNESFASFLVIEEPEAHIHTHIQKTLFDRLNFAETQIIYSTHSTQISEISNIANINIIARDGGVCEVFQPAVGLNPNQIGNVQRYLDAIRSNLLFAKRVILVEGDAEEILIPILVKQVLGLSLDELGISLINIRSTGFENVAILFHDLRIRKHCAIITDHDLAFISTAPDDGDSKRVIKAKEKAIASQKAGEERKLRLEHFCQNNRWLSLHLAYNTFEVDFMKAGNGDTVKPVIKDVYVRPTEIAKAEADIASSDIAQFGTRMLKMADKVGKGWFAILLGKWVTPDTAIPGYILRALLPNPSSLSRAAWANVLDYRLEHIEQVGLNWEDDLEHMRQVVDGFVSKKLNFDDLRAAMCAHFPTDRFSEFLVNF
ncbi:ATP-dependent endonuclease [Gluconobacter japonicus]|uniref:ATP-dependent nuclease n=1 Tax=Gluconobacter japonicus TaxID=376620 RepID=UPI0007830DB4|nr:AAA family ATPase [Gluconobacter japonicus]KXV23548.1 ATP-dependent endonuclease [Gluconobacter japonicus]KXV41621.1 ATP-dependent endonuclease [Gluconobacter japonicus]